MNSIIIKFKRVDQFWSLSEIQKNCPGLKISNTLFFSLGGAPSNQVPGANCSSVVTALIQGYYNGFQCKFILFKCDSLFNRHSNSVYHSIII